ncbi:MAG: HAMP domain-containing protein [Candidatus Omnitrophica bacterium]|nr:HAMP domain-containing protein [Candidatus Omnitrophota bacterium]
MRINSLKFKISFLYSLILGAVLIAYSAFLYVGLSFTLYDELDKELKAKSKATVNVLGLYTKAVGDPQKVADYVFNRIASLDEIDVKLEVITKIDFYWAQQFEKLNMQDDLMQLVGPGGDCLARSRRMSNDLRKIFLAQYTAESLQKPFVFSDIRYKNKVFRLMSAACLINGKPYILQIAASQKPIIQLLKDRWAAIVFSIPFIFILMFLLGRFLLEQMLQPIVKVTRAAEMISHKDLSARLALLQSDEEMKRLVAAFNDMIARLENAFKHIEEFSGQVAHELRTPLAIMRGESELALRKDRDIEEYKRVLKSNLEEIGRMLKTTDDLLLLTKLDYKPEVFKREPLEFNEFYREVADQVGILALKKGVQFVFEPCGQAVRISADRLHLRRLFYNLIHNAVKFTPAGGTVRVSASVKGGKLYAAIADTGCGILAEDLPKVFDRFFHKDRTGASDEPGSGLGLSIAQAVARHHGGEITVESRPQNGSVFTVVLSLA